MNKESMKKYDELMEAATKIKGMLLDCDKQVDQFAQLLAPWYCAPELLTKPLVINMVGMTGIGKTQMFRLFCSELGLNNMAETMTCANNSSVSPGRTAFRMKEEQGLEKGIIFIDEFQNFSCKGMMGTRTNNPSTQEFWDILSDGKIKINFSKDELENLMFRAQGQMNEIAKAAASGEKSLERNFPTFFGSTAYKLFILCKKKVPLEKIKKMSGKESFEFIKGLYDNYDNKPIYSDFTKFLFVTACNLDCVFADAEDVASCEIDADEVYESSKEVNIFDVKEGLGMYFFPEQVARLGNNFVIFHSLSKSTFEKLIDNALDEIVKNTKESIGTEITFDKSVKEMIYRNGVFPTQGARPLISTINGVIASSIPMLVFKQKEADKKITIKYNDETMELEANGVKTSCIGPYDESARRIKVRINERRCTSVHESGHAIVYAESFGAIPRKMVSIVADSRVAAGFISTHLIRHTCVTMKAYICVALAGMVAEEVVFGKDFRTVGCSSDLAKATAMAAAYVRKFAFTDKVKAVVGTNEATYNKMSETSEVINDIIKECIKTTKEIITKNIDLLKEVSEVMFDKTRCTPEEFKAIADKHNKKYTIVSASKKITPNFEERYKMFDESKVKSMEEVSNAKECMSFFDDAYVGADGTMSLASDDPFLLF